MRAVLNTRGIFELEKRNGSSGTPYRCVFIVAALRVCRRAAICGCYALRGIFFFHFLSFTPFIHVTCYVHGVCESRSYCALTSYAIAPERQCGVSNSAMNTATWNRNACSRRSLVTEDIKTVLLSLLQREITQPRITHLIVCCVVLSRYLLQVLYRRTYYLLIYTDKY